MIEHTIESGDGIALWAGESRPDGDGAGGRLPVVFLHGFSGSSSASENLAGRVTAKGHRFIAPDMRGHGLSAKPTGDGAYDFDRFVSDVSAVADGLGVERFHLAGHCMGGMVATAYAARHPQRLASLSLIGTSLQPNSERPIFARVSAAAQGPVMSAAKRFFPLPGSEAGHVDYSRFAGMSDIEWERVVADWRALTAEVGDAILRALRKIDLLETARGLRLPTLVAHGERDMILPPLAARRSHAAIRDSRLLLLPNDNHVSLVLDPASGLFGALTAFAEGAETA